VGSGGAPGIPFSVDDGETWVRDAEAAVFVDCVYVSGCGDVERVGEVVGSGDEGELVLWDARAGL
jgi:hypothetical protein